MTCSVWCNTFPPVQRTYKESNTYLKQHMRHVKCMETLRTSNNDERLYQSVTLQMIHADETCLNRSMCLCTWYFCHMISMNLIGLFCGLILGQHKTVNIMYVLAWDYHKISYMSEQFRYMFHRSMKVSNTTCIGAWHLRSKENRRTLSSDEIFNGAKSTPVELISEHSVLRRDHYYLTHYVCLLYIIAAGWFIIHTDTATTFMY